MSSPAKLSSLFEFPEVRVVEASAGSGKTYALAKRYLQLLLLNARSTDPSLQPPFRSILALTFTLKATFEMKERILKFLKMLAFGEMPENERDEMIRPIGLSPEEARSLAMSAMDSVIRHYNDFQVLNIEKFIKALLVSSAFEIGMTPNFQIKSSSREYLALALDNLIDDAAKNSVVRRAFDDFLNSYLSLEARSYWIPKVVLQDTLDELFSVHNTYAKEFVMGDVSPEDIIRVKAKVLADMRAFREHMPVLNKTFTKSIDNFLATHRSAFHFNSKLSAYFENDELPTVKGSAVTSQDEELWAHIRRGLKHACKVEVEHLYDPYIRLFALTQAKLAEACRKEDVIFLEELNSKARLVFDSGMTAPELYYRLSVRFRHFLLDEFQDTSVLQWKNLSPLPEEALSTGGTLFYVGDKKQAIYSFRGGEAGLFDQLKNEYSAFNVRLDPLTTNRRSCRNIVEFNNQVFSMENLERFLHSTDEKGERLIPARPEDLDRLRSVFAGSSQKPAVAGDPGCVRMEYIAGNNKEERLVAVRERVVSLVKGLHERFEWRDLALLVRSNREVEEATRWLLEENIPTASERTLNVKDHLLVRELIAFLRFLDSPLDDVSFAEFVLGDMFTAASGLDHSAVQDLILEWRTGKRRNGTDYLYTVFRERYPEAWDSVIEDFFRNAGFYPLYELMVSFYRRTGALERFPESRGFLMHILDLVKEAEEDFPDLTSFLKHYDEIEGEDLFVDVHGGDAVRVTTIHKAKGLEFRAVVLPFLTMDIKTSAHGNRAQAYMLRESEEGLKLYHCNERHTHYSAFADELRVEERMRSFFAELNSVYVALTRAECEMYAFIPSRSGKSRNLISNLIPETQFILGEPGSYAPSRKKDEGVKAVEVAPPHCRDWMTFLRDEFSGEDELKARAQRRVGELCHLVLAAIRQIPEGQSAMALEEALKVLPPGSPAGEVKAILDKFLSAASVQDLFSAPRAEFYTEQEIVNHAGHSRRIDRLVVLKDEVRVIDFKTGERNDKDRAQVEEYKAVLKDIYPGRTVRGYLAYVIEAKVEEI